MTKIMVNSICHTNGCDRPSAEGAVVCGVCAEAAKVALRGIRETTHEEARRPSCLQGQSSEFFRGWTSAMETISRGIADASLLSRKREPSSIPNIDAIMVDVGDILWKQGLGLSMKQTIRADGLIRTSIEHHLGTGK